MKSTTQSTNKEVNVSRVGILNPFMDLVYKKVPLTARTFFRYFSERRKFKKFKKNFLRSSPDFLTLWRIADFVRLAEKIYFYDNSKGNILFSSTGYNPGQSGFVIKREEYEIIVKLYLDDKDSDNTTIIHIARMKGMQTKNEYKFVDNQWVDSADETDELLVDNVASIIVKATVDLLDWCYDQRKF